MVAVLCQAGQQRMPSRRTASLAHDELQHSPGLSCGGTAVARSSFGRSCSFVIGCGGIRNLGSVEGTAVYIPGIAVDGKALREISRYRISLDSRCFE